VAKHCIHIDRQVASYSLANAMLLFLAILLHLLVFILLVLEVDTYSNSIRRMNKLLNCLVKDNTCNQCDSRHLIRCQHFAVPSLYGRVRRESWRSGRYLKTSIHDVLYDTFPAFISLIFRKVIKDWR